MICGLSSEAINVALSTYHISAGASPSKTSRSLARVALLVSCGRAPGLKNPISAISQSGARGAV